MSQALGSPVERLGLAGKKTVLFCLCYVNRCEQRSRSNYGRSDPNWLCLFHDKGTVELCTFPPAELQRGKNTKCLGNGRVAGEIPVGLGCQCLVKHQREQERKGGTNGRGPS